MFFATRIKTKNNASVGEEEELLANQCRKDHGWMDPWHPRWHGIPINAESLFLLSSFRQSSLTNALIYDPTGIVNDKPMPAKESLQE